jgi:hypothetical protein
VWDVYGFRVLSGGEGGGTVWKRSILKGRGDNQGGTNARRR